MCKKPGCLHAQCPYPQESGYDCVEVVAGYCEIGENCVKQCQFSYKKNKTQFAIKAFEEKYPSTCTKQINSKFV